MYGNIVPIAGRETFIKKVLNQTIYVRLFVNDLDPDKDTKIDDIVECSLSGYSAIVLSYSDWEIQSQTYTVQAQTVNYLEFQFNESGTIYGYYLTDSDGNLLSVEKFYPSPVEVYNDGKKLKFKPLFYLY